MRIFRILYSIVSPIWIFVQYLLSLGLIGIGILVVILGFLIYYLYKIWSFIIVYKWWLIGILTFIILLRTFFFWIMAKDYEKH